MKQLCKGRMGKYLPNSEGIKKKRWAVVTVNQHCHEPVKRGLCHLCRVRITKRNSDQNSTKQERERKTEDSGNV